MEYPNVYQDLDFLESDECRGVRLMLEYMKPEVVMNKYNVKSTIVVFGSARTPDPDKVCEQIRLIEQDLAEDGTNEALLAKLKTLRQQEKYSHYYEEAYLFSKMVAEASQQDPNNREFVVITGGGGGIMEAANRGACDVGAVTIGLNIELPFEQHPNPYITPELCFHFRYFSMRKMHFLRRAKALCAFPGGFGTLDELFEALTLIQTAKIKRMPVVLFCRDFWEHLINWQHLVDEGVISPEDLDLFRFCDTAQEGWDFIRNYWSYGQAEE